MSLWECMFAKAVFNPVRPSHVGQNMFAKDHVRQTMFAQTMFNQSMLSNYTLSEQICAVCSYYKEDLLQRCTSYRVAAGGDGV